MVLACLVNQKCLFVSVLLNLEWLAIILLIGLKSKSCEIAKDIYET